MTEIENPMAALRRWFDAHPKVLVAFSGGVDSCLVAFLARQFLGKDRAVAVISTSPSLKTSDLADARRFCATYDIRLQEIDAGEINDPNYRSNPLDRCFHCKTALYQTMQGLRQNGFADFEVLNGSNSADQGDYRPGMKAAGENAVFSPLLECGVDKEGVRALAQSLGLFTWDKPASP
jgi:pyridinium-3,5-biscarboxylic acid mononucleotide sulfurtransferase